MKQVNVKEIETDLEVKFGHISCKSLLLDQVKKEITRELDKKGFLGAEIDADLKFEQVEGDVVVTDVQPIIKGAVHDPNYIKLKERNGDSLQYVVSKSKSDNSYMIHYSFTGKNPMLPDIDTGNKWEQIDLRAIKDAANKKKGVGNKLRRNYLEYVQDKSKIQKRSFWRKLSDFVFRRKNKAKKIDLITEAQKFDWMYLSGLIEIDKK